MPADQAWERFCLVVLGSIDLNDPDDKAAFDRELAVARREGMEAAAHIVWMREGHACERTIAAIRTAAQPADQAGEGWAKT